MRILITQAPVRTSLSEPLEGGAPPLHYRAPGLYCRVPAAQSTARNPEDRALREAVCVRVCFSHFCFGCNVVCARVSVCTSTRTSLERRSARRDKPLSGAMMLNCCTS